MVEVTSCLGDEDLSEFLENKSVIKAHGKNRKNRQSDWSICQPFASKEA